jgi:hypothetical protein
MDRLSAGGVPALPEQGHEHPYPDFDYSTQELVNSWLFLPLMAL